MTKERSLRVLKAILLFLVFFDLVIAVPALFFPEWVVGLAKLNADPGGPYRAGDIEPLFFRGVGVLWLLAAYVQLIAWRDPVGRVLVVNIAIVFRFLGGTFELMEVVYLLPKAGFTDPLIYWTLGSFVAGDYLLVGVMIYLLKKLELAWWKV